MAATQLRATQQQSPEGMKACGCTPTLPVCNHHKHRNGLYYLLICTLHGVLDSTPRESSCHCQVMDNLVTSLSKYTLLLHPGGAKPAVEFGNSEKARMACQASFQLANRCAAPH